MNIASDTDRIERSIVINAPRERVWLALSSAEKFGTWFGADLRGQSFAPGQPVRGLMNGSCGHDNLFFNAIIERIEPIELFSYRWHPGAVDPAMDYSAEEKTLVTFLLEDAPEGTLLTVVESGFDQVPAHRRAEAFRMNTGGWAFQMNNLVKYVSA